MCCNVLQCAVMCCNALRCVTVSIVVTEWQLAIETMLRAATKPIMDEKHISYQIIILEYQTKWPTPSCLLLS